MQTVFEFLILFAFVAGVFATLAFVSDIIQKIWED